MTPPTGMAEKKVPAAGPAKVLAGGLGIDLVLSLARCGGHGCTPMVRRQLDTKSRWPDGTGDSTRDRDTYVALSAAAADGTLVVRAPGRDASHGEGTGSGCCPECEWYYQHEDADGSWAGREFELTEAGWRTARERAASF